MTARLTAACRATLRYGLLESGPGLDSAHVASCAFCTAWLEGRERLQAALATPVAPPSELQAAAMLDGVRDRLIEDCETGPVGELLTATLSADELADGEGLELGVPELEPTFAARLRDVPGRAPEWSEVRASVMAEARAGSAEHSAGRTGDRRTGADRNGGRAVGFRVIAAAGLAAAAIAAMNLLAERDVKPVPTIRIADVPSLAGLDYSPMAILRRGGD
ncbi:MAG: hypothetical protein NXI31_05100 [bacterium]|nr:hypothetical protein [bacterium]